MKSWKDTMKTHHQFMEDTDKNNVDMILRIYEEIIVYNVSILGCRHHILYMEEADEAP